MGMLEENGEREKWERELERSPWGWECNNSYSYEGYIPEVTFY